MRSNEKEESVAEFIKQMQLLAEHVAPNLNEQGLVVKFTPKELPISTCMFYAYFT